MEITPAILLRKTRLGETSLILTWFTMAHGRLKTVAKGARQPKSPFAGRLDLFFECEIQFGRSRRSDLHALREVALQNAHEGLRLEYARVAVAAYFVELIELVTEPDHPAPELFDLLQRGFGFLSSHPATARALLHFETELTRLLGIQGQPGVSAAIAIGRVYHHLPPSRAALLKMLKEK
ncbi:MAG: repair protein RecO [Chthoniobacter sp.]|nr:repair protein RecO [Chthoniobacter sp.]